MQSLNSVQREGFVHVIGVVAKKDTGGESLHDLTMALLFGQATVRTYCLYSIVNHTN
jgi:hypothetical protein